MLAQLGERFITLQVGEVFLRERRRMHVDWPGITAYTVYTVYIEIMIEEGGLKMTVATSPEVEASVSKSAPAKAAPKLAPAAKARKSTSAQTAVASAAGKVGKTDAKVKPAAKAKAKSAADAAPKASEKKAAKAVRSSKEKKVSVKKPKLIRDSFTFPEADYALIGALKQRALKAGHEVKKSELVRAGLTVLSGLNENALLKVLNGVDKLKTGRPQK